MDLELSRKMYEIFFPGKNREDSLQNDVIVITGGKGLGKTTLAKYIAKLYKKYNKYDRIILLTGITNVKFPSYVKVINLNNIKPDENLDISMFKNSLVIFDDWENHPDPEIQTFLDRLVNLLAQNGRNYKISLVVILHHLNKGFKSTTLLREMDALILFPEKFDNNVFNTLINHFGLTRKMASSLFNLKSKFVLVRNSSPYYYFVSDEGKTFPLKS
jgi:predicted AAA+ superfamily ATPase